MWFTLGIGLDGLAGGEDLDILEDRLGKGTGGTRQVVGSEDIHVRARIEESGHADDLVGAHGGRAHPRRNLGGQTNARAFHAQVTLQDRLPCSQRTNERMANHCITFVEGTGQRDIARPVNHSDVLRGESHARGQFVRRGNDLSNSALRKA